MTAPTHSPPIKCQPTKAETSSVSTSPIPTKHQIIRINSRNLGKERLLPKLASKLIRYYLLSLFGFAIACVIAIILDIFPALTPLLPFLQDCFLRLGLLTFCFIGVVAVVESVR